MCQLLLSCDKNEDIQNRFKMKILFKDHYFLETKIKKYEIDSKC